MILNGEGRRSHYLAVKGTTSKSKSGFYCLNCLHSFRTKNKLVSHNKKCENKDFYNVNKLKH